MLKEYCRGRTLEVAVNLDTKFIMLWCQVRTYIVSRDSTFVVYTYIVSYFYHFITDGFLNGRVKRHGPCLSHHARGSYVCDSGYFYVC